jgi:hypothetical protein
VEGGEEGDGRGDREVEVEVGETGGEGRVVCRCYSILSPSFRTILRLLSFKRSTLAKKKQEKRKTTLKIALVLRSFEGKHALRKR